MSITSIFAPLKGLAPLFLGSLVIAIGNLLIVFMRIEVTDTPIALHYNVYYGIDLIGAWWRIYTLPAVGFAILVVNVCVVLVPRVQHLTRLLMAISTITCEIVLLAASILILRINL